MKHAHLLLMAALLAGGATQLHADEVTLSTALQTGEPLSLALNCDLEVNLTWGNGDVVQLTSDGSLQTLTVKDPQLTITSTTGRISSLYVQGDKLTALNLAGAPNLTQLLAADNELTSLDATACTKLTQVDLQNNALTELDLSKAPQLKEVNVAYNAIETNKLNLHPSARIDYYIATGNKMTRAGRYDTNLYTSKVIWVNGNLITSLKLNSNNLRSIVASDNKINTFSIGENPMLTDLWLDNNELTAIDLTKGTPKLYSFTANDNQLHSILWDTSIAKICKYAYVQNNALMVNSLPNDNAKTGATYCCVLPQDPYRVEDQYALNTLTDFSAFAKNGWGNAIASTLAFFDHEGNKLVKGTDYTETQRKVTFKKDLASVTMTVTSKNYYGGNAFRTTTFHVGDPDLSGISDAVVDGKLNVTGEAGRLTVDAPTVMRIQIVSAEGRKISDAIVAKGTHSWALPTGGYVVNGQKVIVR